MEHNIVIKMFDKTQEKSLLSTINHKIDSSQVSGYDTQYQYLQNFSFKKDDAPFTNENIFDLFKLDKTKITSISIFSSVVGESNNTDALPKKFNLSLVNASSQKIDFKTSSFFILNIEDSEFDMIELTNTTSDLIAGDTLYLNIIITTTKI